MMAVAFQVVGSIAVLLLTSSALVAAIAYLVDCRAKSRWQQDQVLIRDTKREVGNLLCSLCHWFSEDVGAWKAVEAIGKEMLRSGDVDISACRDRWREEMLKEAQEQIP